MLAGIRPGVGTYSVTANNFWTAAGEGYVPPDAGNARRMETACGQGPEPFSQRKRRRRDENRASAYASRDTFFPLRATPAPHRPFPKLPARYEFRWWALRSSNGAAGAAVLAPSALAAAAPLWSCHLTTENTKGNHHLPDGPPASSADASPPPPYRRIFPQHPPRRPERRWWASAWSSRPTLPGSR